MRLTLRTDYALRVLLYVGLKHDDLAIFAEILQINITDAQWNQNSTPA
jgi:hypothetical protein